MTADAIDADGLFLQHAVETDARLLMLLRVSQSALTQIWNRYFLAAYLATLPSASPAKAVKLVATAFRAEVAEAKKDGSRPVAADSFAAGWLGRLGVANPSDRSRRAVAWAFYALSGRNRTVLWRTRVDGWPGDRLAAELNLPVTLIPAVIGHATAWFGKYLADARGLLGLTAETDSLSAGGVLTGGLLGQTLDEYARDPAVPVETILRPPPAPVVGHRETKSARGGVAEWLRTRRNDLSDWWQHPRRRAGLAGVSQVGQPVESVV
ncbi:MAG: hypothetical protein LBI33_08625 [Propionibacteriaceae bacterium]|jgi:hypothetical protein|nr:hypothetical protein [Propionibacteriaceae bacterium]